MPLNLPILFIIGIVLMLISLPVHSVLIGATGTVFVLVSVFIARSENRKNL